MIVYPELFINKDTSFYWGQSSTDPFEQETILQLRNDDPLAFLDRFIFDATASNIRAVGFKCFYEHAAEKNWRCVWDYIREKRLKVIHLRRADVLRSLVSMKIAQRTSRWTSRDGVAPDVQISLHFGECVDYFEKIPRYWAQFTDYFANNDTYTLEYEDLCNKTELEMRQIQQFLKVPLGKLQSSLQKQNPLPVWRYLSNYADLKKDFKGSKWERYFQQEAPE